MSSLVRRLQIRAIKERGYVRTMRDACGNPVRRGGIIVDPDNKPIGTRWPRFLPRTQ